MGAVFAWRGNSLNPRFSWGPKFGIPSASSSGNLPAIVSDGTAIGGSALSLDAGDASTQNRNMNFHGRILGPSTSRKYSVLVRIKLDSATYGGHIGFWLLGVPTSMTPSGFGLGRLSNGDCRTIAGDQLGVNRLNSNFTTSWSPTTAAWLDFLYTIDATLTTNNVKMYVDGSQLGSSLSFNATTHWPDNPADYINNLILGRVSWDVGTTFSRFNEVVIWDEIVNPASVALVGGTGALNGASRTEFVDVPEFDGSSYSDPGEGNVRLGTAYIFAGASKSGTVVVPSLANTKVGVAGDGGVGLYDGSDRWSDPGEDNVLFPIDYKANSLTDNKQGNYVAPPASTDPGEENVRLNTEYTFEGESKVGTLDLPPEEVVKEGYVYDNETKTGVYALISGTPVGGGILKKALNALTSLHSRTATMKRLGSPDIYSPCRIAPSNYFRFLRGPEHTTVKGTEFIIPVDSMLGHYGQSLKFSAVPTQGQFKLKFGTNTTDAFDYDVEAAEIQEALREFEGLQDVVVSGDFAQGFKFAFVGFQLATGMGQVTESTLMASGDAVTATWATSFVPWSEPIKKGDRIQDGSKQWTVDEIIEMHDMGAQVMAYRVRVD